MRPDFQCGICHEIVPEYYYGGCCAICSRIRCNNCMRSCPVCTASLCPECLGEVSTPGVCAHRPLTPYRNPDDIGPAPWSPRTPKAAASPVGSSPQPPPVERWHTPGWTLIAAAMMAVMLVYLLRQFL